MHKRMLVVVEREAWVHRALADAADGFELVECSTAREGLNACCALEPDCLLTALRLNDAEGLWLIEALRAQPGPVGPIPVVAMVSRPQNPSGQGGGRVPLRVQALNAGADVVLQKPLEVGEVLAQVGALLAMVARVRAGRRLLPSLDGVESFGGDLEHTPITSVLSTLEQEKKSGELQLATQGAVRQKLVLSLACGTLVGGWIDTTPLTPLEAMRLALGWQGRRFEFVRGQNQSPSPGATIGQIFLEAIRRRASIQRGELSAIADLPAVSSRPPAPAAQPAPRRQTLRRVTAPAPGQRLVESVAPGPRPDPRAEVDA